LIKHTIREYRPNELYASQWLDIFINQAMFTDNQNSFKAEPTLTELIDNNERILKSRIKKVTINRFVDMILIQDKHKKYVNILRALVNCDGEAIVSNQGEISKLLLEDMDTKYSLLHALRVSDSESGEVEIHVYEKWMLLSDFEGESEEKADELFEFFYHMILLLSDLCLNRNFTAIHPLSDLFPFELCFKIISGNYMVNLRHAFLRLTITLWIDRDFTKITLPNKIRIWTRLGEDSQVILTNNSTENYHELKGFVLEYL